MLKNPQVVVRAEPWSIRAWRPVELPSARAHLPWSQFHHMGTKVGDYDDEGRAIGNTMWAAELGDGALVGASWDWVEVRPGVVALRDPNGVLTNLRFIDEDGHLEPELKAICLQNLIPHQVAWQEAVLQRLSSTFAFAA